jgi:hypothetical protein
MFAFVPASRSSSQLIKRGALSDANYQTTKLSKINSSVWSSAPRRGTLLVGSRSMPIVWHQAVNRK